jgi:hypothetical protein
MGAFDLPYHLGQNHQEGCFTIGMHCLQIQDAAGVEALQTVSYSSLDIKFVAHSK